jgi:aspartate racemase
MIGGMSAESTSHYYRLLNQLARERLGGRHTARLLLWSVDFGVICELQEAGDWRRLSEMMIDAAKRLESVGAEALLIGANTMHKMADEVEAAISIPLIHIADVTASALKAKGAHRPLLLATRPTMEEAFWRDRLKRGGVEAIVPDETDRCILHAIIFDELVHGKFLDASRAKLMAIVEKERARGIDSVILGCTELGILTPPQSFSLPAVDTAELHAIAAIDFALAKNARV